MDQTVNRKSNNKVIVLNKIKTYFSKPQNVILLLFGIVLTFTTVAPIVAIVKDTLMIHPGTIDAHLTGKASGYTIVNYVDLFTSQNESVETVMEYAAFSGIDLSYLDSLWRRVRIPCHEDQFKV